MGYGRCLRRKIEGLPLLATNFVLDKERERLPPIKKIKKEGETLVEGHA